MNTFPVERLRENGGDYLRIGGQRLAAKDLSLKVPDAQTFILGTRPKHVVLGAADAPGRIKGRVHTFEVLGDLTLASIELDSGDLVFKIGEAGLRLALDEPVSFSFDPEKVLFYDAKTTLRIH